MYNIHLLPASFGDSILIEYGQVNERHYILIDGGPYFNFDHVAASVKALVPAFTHLELLIVTHIDIDHIDGIITLLNHSSLPFTIGEVWFNGYKQLKSLQAADELGPLQGDYLSMLIGDKKLTHNSTYFQGGPVVVKDDKNLPRFSLPGGMEITLLSPGLAALNALARIWEKESKYLNDLAALREKFEDDHRYQPADLLGDEKIDVEALQKATVDPDKSVANESAIAFIGTYEGKSCLFAGDAPTDALLRAIRPMLDAADEDRLKLNAWKIAHHGSAKSTTDSLMAYIDAELILVSSDGSKYKHPNPETIAKLLKHAERPLAIYFNYRTVFNEIWDDKELKEKYGYSTNFGEGTKGISISL
jgi:beta-lactamase superfamily II metal-dependent hydrolase